MGKYSIALASVCGIIMFAHEDPLVKAIAFYGMIFFLLGA